MYEVGPYKCSQCGEIECNHSMVGDKPSLPGKGKWDMECPGGDKCECNTDTDN